MKSINHHSKSKNSKRIPSSVGLQPFYRCRWYGCGPAELEMFQGKNSQKKEKKKNKNSSFFLKFFFETFQA
jgi:hypothetical protein